MNWRTLSQCDNQMDTIIQNLINLDSQRQDRFFNFTTVWNLSLDELILADSVKYDQQSIDFQPDYEHWATVSHITSIDFMKRLEFVKKLPSYDLNSLIKSNHMQIFFLCNAMRSYCDNKGYVCYPGGIDFIPASLASIFPENPKILNKHNCSLIGKLAEVRITTEEFLLLSAILICNTVSSKLTVPSQNLVSQYQRMYSSTLLQYCLNTYQHCGPSRFTDLLSISHIINGTLESSCQIVLTLKYYQPKPQIKQLFIDIMSSMDELPF
ncbi:hypothetical protein CRE_07832 [Caenorhabditis remanei]|uniref:NR LBD domain-containing protein n=1 Tax=Caenorhabditis remanei TaxID=31234 RepID=E3NEK5_CAERE|nr:hypothetical protein CRE_07832 [Caenorhabditis remanei]